MKLQSGDHITITVHGTDFTIYEEYIVTSEHATHYHIKRPHNDNKFILLKETLTKMKNAGTIKVKQPISLDEGLFTI